MILGNYLKYRGKCKEYCEQVLTERPDLTLVRGWYYEPLWDREEQHWWLKDPDGNIIDLTCLQFPSGGMKEFYREFDGILNCSQCDKEITEETALFHSGYCFCSSLCNMRFIGI